MLAHFLSGLLKCVLLNKKLDPKTCFSKWSLCVDMYRSADYTYGPSWWHLVCGSQSMVSPGIVFACFFENNKNIECLLKRHEFSYGTQTAAGFYRWDVQFGI